MPTHPLGGSLQKNAYRRAIIVLAGLTALFGALALVSSVLRWVRPSSSFLRLPLAFSLALLAVFGLILAAVWLLGWRKARQARDFLYSERPVIRWTYSTAEWQEMLATAWRGEKDDWKAQLGCLTALISLAGLLAGGLIGRQQGLGAMVADSLVGAFVAGLAGGLIAGVVAAGNHLAARLDYEKSEPGQVALAPDEIYANGEYFKGNGRTSGVLEARLRPGHPALLRIIVRVVPWRADISSEENWQIPVPANMVDQVEANLKELFTR